MNEMIHVMKQDDITIEELIQEVYVNHSKKREKMRDLYNRYVGNVPINSRSLANPHKVNNKLNNDFYGDIVDAKTGYMGNIISIDLLGEDTPDYRKKMEFISKWNRQQNLEDINADTIKMSAICGYSARLLYNSPNGARVRNVPYPWEVVVLYDDDTGDPYLGFWFYSRKVKYNSVITRVEVVEVYDDVNMSIYHKEGNEWVLKEKIPHLFQGVPLFTVENNSELLGDYEKALELIEAYDRAISDGSSEFEQLRLAYAFIKGMKLDDEFVELMKQTGIMPLDEGAEFGFISKNIDMGSIKILLDEIRNNIYKFCKSVNFDEVNSGDVRVLGWKTRLMPLENKCKIAERKMMAKLRYQYKLLTGYWRQFNSVNIDYLDITFKFVRNIPYDIQGEAQALQTLNNLVSKKTAFEQISFISDPQEEIEAMENEKT